MFVTLTHYQLDINLTQFEHIDSYKNSFNFCPAFCVSDYINESRKFIVALISSGVGGGSCYNRAFLRYLHVDHGTFFRLKGQKQGSR